MSFTLVLYIYAGMLAQGDSVALHSLPGFKSEAECKVAGKSADALVAGSAKNVRFLCVKQGF